MSEQMTTIYVSKKIKEQLNKMKQHKRETYNDVLERIVAKH